MSLLQVEHLSAYYESSQALFDVSLSVAKGEVVALMGRNGMGKTTTIKTICRMLRHREGNIYFDGISLNSLSSSRAARLGIGLVPEGRRCFANLTVQENLLVAARPGHWDLARVFAFFPRLGERTHQLSASLSGGEQQMLAIGRALMTNPTLLILDEATEGLAPIIRQEIWKAINQLKAATELSILLVDKSLKELTRVADRAVILQRGKSIWNGAMSSLTEEISNQYMGV